MLGLDVGGVSGCPALRDCTNNQKHFDIAAGKFGAIFGVEAEVALSPEFFGEAPGLSSSVLTLMGNLMLGPKAGPLRPYILMGAGLMKARFDPGRRQACPPRTTRLLDMLSVVACSRCSATA